MRDRVAGSAAAGEARVSANRRRQSENGPWPIGAMPGLDATQSIHDAGFDAAWEADLFGARRRALEGAGARLQVTEAEAQGVRMRIVSEVARTWFTAVGAGRELQAQHAALATLQQTLDLVRLRHAAGDASAADVDAADAQWAVANALLPGLESRQRAAVLGLGVLLGAPRSVNWRCSMPHSLRASCGRCRWASAPTCCGDVLTCWLRSGDSRRARPISVSRRPSCSRNSRSAQGVAFNRSRPATGSMRPARASPSCRWSPGGCSTAGACVPRSGRVKRRNGAAPRRQAVLGRW